MSSLRLLVALRLFGGTGSEARRVCPDLGSPLAETTLSAGGPPFECDSLPSCVSVVIVRHLLMTSGPGTTCALTLHSEASAPGQRVGCKPARGGWCVKAPSHFRCAYRQYSSSTPDQATTR